VSLLLFHHLFQAQIARRHWSGHATYFKYVGYR
jgi:hypothetical protein